MSHRHGGDIIGEQLAKAGVEYLFTLCGGHISPILQGAEHHGIKVVDVRDEVTAAFAADAVSRMTGVPGIAAVTAGPGVTNTMTAVKNAQMAQSPMIVLGGATATLLRGRGSLQDIDQMALMKPVTKWCTRVTTIAALVPTLKRAFEVAMEGVPGPVFIEVPVDLLYPEDVVRDWTFQESGVDKMTGVAGKAFELFLKGHLAKQFHGPHVDIHFDRPEPRLPFGPNEETLLERASKAVANAERPVLVVGAQALVNMSPDDALDLADAINVLGLPTYLGGTARGLLGRYSDIQFRHKRTAALKEADVVIIAGFPFDFRLGYGRKINSKATLIAANLSPHDLRKNRKPDVAIEMHPGKLIEELASRSTGPKRVWDEWFVELREREDARDAEIAADAEAHDGDLVSPLYFFQRLEELMSDDGVIIVDGGDFVATGSYILRPRGPFRWLDPGVFGTLGVGGGFTVGASLVHSDSEIWLLYGDGSSGYSLAEFDTYRRHGLAPIAVIGTDASWQQIARDQIKILDDDVGTVLRKTAYHDVAEGYGGVGLLLTDQKDTDKVINEAKKLAAEGKAVCINIHLAGSDFREGSLSM